MRGKTVWKWIAIAVAVVLLIGAGSLYWLWRQVTALPEWYDPDAVALEQDVGPDAAPPQWIALDERGDPIDDPDLEAGPLQQAEATLEVDPAGAPRRAKRSARAHEMRGFHRGAKASQRPGGKAVKASRAHYADGRLEAGMVLDLSRIPTDKLTDRDRKLYDRAVRNFPGLTKRDVYVGIEDAPVTRDGYLQLGPSPRVRVGNLRYDLDDAAGKLGMGEAQLRREVDRELRRMGMVDPDAPAPAPTPAP